MTNTKSIVPKNLLSPEECAELIELLEKSKLETNQLLHDTSLDWTVVRNDDLHIEKIRTESKDIFRMEFDLNCSVELFADRFHPSGPYRIQWDKDMEDVQLLDVFGKNNEYNAILHKFKPQAGGLVQARESLDVVKYEITKKGRRAYAVSFTHPKYPPKDGYVRIWGYPGGLWLDTIEGEPNKCHVKIVYHVDMKLKLIPNFVYNWLFPKISGAVPGIFESAVALPDQGSGYYPHCFVDD